jgi:hypothetical protein
MLEFIGFITVCYLAIKLLPKTIEFTIKLAVALLFVLILFLCLQVVYHWWLINTLQI